MLEGILAIQDMPLKPMYTNRDVARVFAVCVRAIQNWISVGLRHHPAHSKLDLAWSRTYNPSVNSSGFVFPTITPLCYI